MRTLGLILCAGMFAVPSAAKLKVGIDVDIAKDDIKSSAAWTKGAQLLDGTIRSVARNGFAEITPQATSNKDHISPKRTSGPE